VTLLIKFQEKACLSKEESPKASSNKRGDLSEELFVEDKIDRILKGKPRRRPTQNRRIGVSLKYKKKKDADSRKKKTDGSQEDSRPKRTVLEKSPIMREER